MSRNKDILVAMKESNVNAVATQPMISMYVRFDIL